MDERHLRSILLNLHSRLTDTDRERLHFYLLNDVPRPLGDDSSLSGTLKLMQSLFDQDKINENDFTFLIDAFQQIRCFDAAKLLKEHQRRMQLNGSVQLTQSLVSMMPTMVKELLDDCADDKYPTDCFTIKSSNDIHNKNNTTKSNNMRVDSINISQDTQTIISSEKKRFWTYFFTKKKIFLPYILFMLTLAVLLALVIGGMKRINNLEGRLRNQQNLNNSTPDQNTENVTQLVNRLLEKQAVIDELNKTFIELQKQTKTSLIKAGQKFGGDGGSYFDDSLLSLFTYTHYLTGIVVFSSDIFDSCQFIYSSPRNNQSYIESTIHGLHHDKNTSSYKYYFDHDERIDTVSVKSTDIDFITSDDFRFTTNIVIKLQFITTKGRRIPPGALLQDDDVQSESFRGYTLGYATGRTGVMIDQLKFYWYRTTN